MSSTSLIGMCMQVSASEINPFLSERIAITWYATRTPTHAHQRTSAVIFSTRSALSTAQVREVQTFHHNGYTFPDPSPYLHTGVCNPRPTTPTPTPAPPLLTQVSMHRHSRALLCLLRHTLCARPVCRTQRRSFVLSASSRLRTGDCVELCAADSLGRGHAAAVLAIQVHLHLGHWRARQLRSAAGRS